MAAGGIFSDIVDSSSAIVVMSLSGRQGRHSEVPRSCFRCHGPKDGAGLTLDVRGFCDGLFYVAILKEGRMYLILTRILLWLVDMKYVGYTYFS